mgnify:FL=1
MGNGIIKIISLSLIFDSLKANWAFIFDVEPVPETLFMEKVFASQYDAVIMNSLLKTNPALVEVVRFYF